LHQAAKSGGFKFEAFLLGHGDALWRQAGDDGGDDKSMPV
jgi:hypothetical protein